MQSSTANSYAETLRVFWKNHTTYNEREGALITTVYLFNRAEQMCLKKQNMFHLKMFLLCFVVVKFCKHKFEIVSSGQVIEVGDSVWKV